jgi:hypothetical protein
MIGLIFLAGLLAVNGAPESRQASMGQCVHKWLFLAILAIFNASGHVAMAWPFTRIRKFFLKYIK